MSLVFNKNQWWPDVKWKWRVQMVAVNKCVVVLIRTGATERSDSVTVDNKNHM